MSVNLDRLIRLAGALRADSASTAWGGWSNAITGLGTDADKSTGWRFTPPRQWTVNELGGLFDGDSIAKRAVSAVVEDGLRGGFELAVNGDTSAGEAWLKKADAAIARAGQVTSFSELVHEILIEARLYGGVLAVPIREAGHPLTPLAPGEPVFSIQWAEPDVAHVLDWFDDPRSPRIGQPWIWGVQLQTGAGASINAEVHYSRVFPVFGNTSPQRRRFLRSLYRFWPPSVLYPVLEALRLFRSAMAGLGVLLQDFGQGVYLVSDLDQVLTTGNDGATQLAEWMQVRDTLKSAVNAIVLDAGGKDKNPESYSRQSVTLTEVSNLIDRFMALVSEATSTPISRLFGQAPSGLSTDDLSGTRAWYDQCATFRTRRAEPTIRELISACENMEGVGPAPAGYEIEWPSLWQYSPAEESEARLKVAQGDAIYLAEGVVTPEAVGRTRAQPDGWRQELPFEPAPEPLIDQVAGEFDPSATPGDRARAPAGPPNATPKP